MDRSWYWKAGFIAAVTLLAIWALVPSVTYFRMPATERNETSAFDKARPKWAPAKHLNLGLDLQGGIHLVMGVEVDKAVREKAVRRAEEISAELERKDIKGADVRGDPDTGIVTVTVPDVSKAKNLVSDEYTDMYIRRVTGSSFELTMKDDAVKQLKEGAVDQAVKAIRNRVDKWGVSEPTIAKRGDASILVQLPGYSNPEKAKELIGKTAQLEFKIVDDADQTVTTFKDLPEGVTLDWDRYTGAGDATVSSPFLKSADRTLLEQYIKDKAPKDHVFAIGKIETRPGVAAVYRTWLLDRRQGLTGEYITDARVAFDQSPGEGNRPYVQLTFNKTGADLFGTLTKNNVKKRMAIVLDDTVDSAPIIQTEIPGGICSIHLGGLKPINEILDEAKDLALVLKSGALPAPVRILEERSVGASLGPELIRRGSMAALVGLLAVLLFMAVYYRFSGVVADVALVLNGLVVLAIMAGLNSTLTLPGIAGFVLTLGMAVDANVLINERIREELKTGKAIGSAIKTGYDKVFWTIFDGHVTALVAGFVIRAYGSGPVRGFATTLIIGLLASMFTSIVVTRAIVEWFVSHGKLHKAVSF
ncbi:MAG: protein translocase subunit SecD [Myxococcales bacterium]|nr:protein translocase subunit SecD [Myxococcales bacterium]